MALLVSLGSCTEPRDTTGSGGPPPFVDAGGPDQTTVVLPPTDARPDGDAARDVATPAHLVLDKTAHDFGLVLVNTGSATAEFVVTNDGGAASGAVTAMLTGPPVGFAVTTDECMGKPLQPGARCRVVTRFSPAVPGKVQGTLKFSAGGVDLTATLTAEGITPGALQITPTPQDFGTAVPPAPGGTQTFTVANTGQEKSGAIVTTAGGTDAKSFDVTADGCVGQMLASLQTCKITVRFNPTTVGAKSMSLNLAATPGGSAIAQLTGTAITPGSVVFTPTSFDFGSVQQNKPGMTKQFIAQNKGQATTAMLTTAVSTADFAVTDDTCAGHTLIANAMCTVTIQFMPTTPGSKLATLSVTELNGGSAAAQLTGTSLANPVLKITPAIKDFNSVTMNTPATATFQVANDGDVASAAPMVPVISGTDAAQFTVPPATNGCTAAIPAKGSCTLSVRFLPTSLGLKGATLTVSAGATTGGTASATLAGTGITTGVLMLNLTSFDFHGVEQNTVSPVSTFTLTNTGQTTTGPVSARIVGSAVFTIVSNLCNAMSLAPANTCSLTVRFEPAAPGPANSTLEITATPGSTVTASLNGTGLPPASLVINPPAVTFPSTVIGATSANQVFTVTNGGGVPAGTGTGLMGVLGRTDAADFKLVTSNCTGVLAPGNSCMAVVAFAPRAVGDKSASLTVSGNPGGAAVAALAGTAQNPARLMVAAAAGSAAAYGNVLVATSSDKTFVVSNTGNQSSSAVGITLAASTGAVFSLLAPTTGECVPGTTVLGGGASCTVRVRFAPTVAGMQTATLSASATVGGTATLGLTGVGQRNAALTGTATNNFGTVVLGNTSGTFNWTVTNGGDVPTGVPTLVNGNAAELIINTNSCTAPIPAGGNCVIGVAVRPSATGARSGMLTLSANPGGSVTFTATADSVAAAGLVLAPANGSVTNFGNVLVGAMATQTFQLTNSGQQPTTAVTVTLTPVMGSGFALVAPTTGECVSGTTILAGGASCAIRVRFTAPAAGMQTANLAATATVGGTTTTLALLGNGQRPALLAGTTTNNYNTVVVGTTSASVTWTITNGGDVATGVPALTNSNPSELIVDGNTCTVPVAAVVGTVAGRCTITVSFRPSIDGARSGTLTLAATPGGSVTFTASATGQKPAALTLAPDTGASANFGNVQVGSNVVQTFVVTNTGQQTTTPLTVTFTAAPTSGFAVVAPVAGDCVTATTTLIGGGRCTIHVRFTAPGAGVQTASLNASAATGGSAVALSLSGNGQRAAQLTGSTSNDFGSIVVNTPSGGATWTVTNNGDMPSPVPVLTNNNPTEVLVSQNMCTTALAGGDTCTISVSFRPSSTLPAPARMGTLTLTAGSAGSVTYLATATALSAASLTLAPQPPSQVDFGSVLVGDSQDGVFVVTNGGQGPTSALTVSFASATTDFTRPAVAGDCANGTTLTAGGTAGSTCLLHVHFAPSDNMMRTASLGVSATTGGSPALTLVGQGQDRASLTLTAQSGQQTTNLGFVLVGDTATAVFVLRNSGTSLDQAASGISIVLTAAAGFSFSTDQPDNCATLGGGKTCQIRVLFTPQSAGTPPPTSLSVIAAVGGATLSFKVTGTGLSRPVYKDFPLPTNGTGPYGIARAGDGTIWFTETAAAQISQLNPATGIITPHPLLNAQSAPLGIAAASDGSVWFTESGASAIGHLTPDGMITEFPTTAGAKPTDIVVAADGTIWFTEATTNAIGHLTTAGEYGSTPLTAPNAQPQGITFGPDGNLWFAESGAGNLGTLGSGGLMEWPILTPAGGPFGIAAGADGRIWFTEQQGNKIGAMTPAGAPSEYPQAPLLTSSGPAGITLGSDTFIWFVEPSAGKIARITADGVVTEFAGPPGSAPQSIVAGAESTNTLYFTDPGTSRIWRVTF